MKKLKFDSRLKYAAIKGQIPEHLKPLVKKHHICKWKKEDHDSIIGFNYYNTSQENVLSLQLIINELKQNVQTLIAENKILNLLREVFLAQFNFRSSLEKYKPKLIDIVNHLKKIIGTESLN